jgi:hypothetical protein
MNERDIIFMCLCLSVDRWMVCSLMSSVSISCFKRTVDVRGWPDVGKKRGGDGGRLVSHIFSALFLPSLSAFVLVVAVVESGGPVRWTTVVCV